MIRKGSKGEEVSMWQSFLGSRKYKIAADGDFGPNTDRATRDFQKKNSLDADGIVGPKTYEAKAKLTGALVTLRGQSRSTDEAATFAFLKSCGLGCGSTKSRRYKASDTRTLG